MKIATIDSNVLALAANGDLKALDALLVGIQPGVFNLCVRMLGNRDDAADACQEILLKVTTHLGSFRGDAAFSTWVYQVARNHLLNASTRSRESPELSFDALSATLQAGLDLGIDTWNNRALQPDEKFAAREMAVTCTQGMLMRLDREHRLAYLLDAVFGLSSDESAKVLEISATAYRKRLSRARKALEGFAQRACGLVNSDAACRCEKQVHALQQLELKGMKRPAPSLQIDAQERQRASNALDSIMHMSDMAGVLRCHPHWQAPERQLAAIRLVLTTHTPTDAYSAAWTRTSQ
jgi:RNA polymerase sigma factor (sigma-70 family)